MKKVIFTLATVCALYLGSNAQTCGTGGSSICTPSGTLTQPGLAPKSDSLAPLINGTAIDQTIQFKNFDTVRAGGTTYHVISLRVDTIDNLPSGLCWQTNSATNTWLNQENGCIRVSGALCAAPGQYKLRIIVTVTVGTGAGFPLQTNADAAGLSYFIRVNNPSDPVTAIDSVGTPFLSYPLGGTAEVKDCHLGINEISNSVESLNVVPNPFTNTATVTFFSEKNANMTETITNMIGSVVSKKTVEVKVGNNNSTIEKGSLPAGVYFYTLTEGTNMSTKRIVISE